MIFCDVVNFNGDGCFVLATDEEHAENIAKKYGHIKNKAKRIVILEAEENISKLMEEERCGVLHKEIKPMRASDFLREFVKNGTPPEFEKIEEPWQFSLEV